MPDDDIEDLAYQAGNFFLIKFGAASASMDWLRKFAEKVAAAEAEKHKWDIHSCGPTCGRYVCVARRKAVEAEREAIIDIIEEYRISLPVLGELKAEIRARKVK